MKCDLTNRNDSNKTLQRVKLEGKKMRWSPGCLSAHVTGQVVESKARLHGIRVSASVGGTRRVFPTHVPAAPPLTPDLTNSQR